jgi:hypothetical protein
MSTHSERGRDTTATALVCTRRRGTHAAMADLRPRIQSRLCSEDVGVVCVNEGVESPHGNCRSDDPKGVRRGDNRLVQQRLPDVFLVVQILRKIDHSPVELCRRYIQHSATCAIAHRVCVWRALSRWVKGDVVHVHVCAHFRQCAHACVRLRVREHIRAVKMATRTGPTLIVNDKGD